MISCDEIVQAHSFIIEQWGENGKRVIEECAKTNPFNGTLDEFIKCCTSCGGNLCGTLLTGIRNEFPNVYKAIPDNLGEIPEFGFIAVLHTLTLCGVEK